MSVKRTMVYVIIAVTVSVFVLQNAYAESNYILMNFDASDKVTYNKWDASADYEKIRHWGQNRGLVLVNDSGPFSDKKASFVSRYGSVVNIENLDPNKNYTLYIDFVSYKLGKGGILSRLVISADGTKIADITFGGQNNERLFSVQIPRDIIYDGKVSLLFKEFATTNGVWGIWDMILTDGDLPESITQVKEKPTVITQKDKMVESVNTELDKRRHSYKKNTGEKTVKPAPKDKKDDKKIVDPDIRNTTDPEKPTAPGAKAPKAPDTGEKKIKDPVVPTPDVRN